MKKLILVFMFLMILGGKGWADTETKLICIRFTQDTIYGSYSDSLFFTESVYASLSKPEVDALKQARVDSFINRMENLPPQEELDIIELRSQEFELRTNLNTVIDLLASLVSKEELEDMKAEYEANALAIQNKIDDKELTP